MRSLIAKVELMEITESMLNLKVVFLKGIIDQFKGSLSNTNRSHRYYKVILNKHHEHFSSISLDNCMWFIKVILITILVFALY